METNGIWKEHFRVGAYMVDQDQQLKLPMMCNLFQEVAGNHANYRKLGFYEMREANRFWVLNKIKMEVYEYPRWQDEIEISTWVSMMRGPFSNRHFAVRRGRKELAAAFSFWVAVDMDTLKPVRIDASGVVVLEEEASCGPADKLKSFEGGKALGSYVVQRSDIDILGHVNNVKYTEWLLNQKDIDPLPKSLQINYLQETRLEDTVRFYRSGNQIALRNQEDGATITLFQL